MPIKKYLNPHDDSSRKTLDHGSTRYNELLGNPDSDGLTYGVFTVEGDSGIAAANPYGAVGIVTKGSLFVIDSTAPNERHVFKEGDVFHIMKGSTYKWGAEPYGEAFYVVPKPINEEIREEGWKQPVF
ncbi:hypothetical protein BD779DRAFT_674359 [Infundibulicybe gibba]|nr:hypothetical protein BD779DRAFT_674359 [Infundibulicybe gibba]